MPSIRFNHMELTLPPGSLDEGGLRQEIVTFYGDVFGLAPFDVDILGQNALLIPTDEEVSQFILVAESPKPLNSPGYDHLGFLMETRAEVDEALEKCKKWRERDDRVQIKEYDDIVQGDLVVRAFYVKHLLPIYFDVQCMEWKPGSEPKKEWVYR